MKRTKVIEALNELPDDFELEQLVEKLVVIERIEAGLKQEADGATVAMEDVEQYFVKKWAGK